MKVKFVTWGNLPGKGKRCTKADLIVDVRHLPNPHFDPALKELDGRDLRVREYIIRRPGTLTEVERLLRAVRGADASGGELVTIGLFCTGGRHRSVALAEIVADRLRTYGDEVTCEHTALSLS